MNDIHIPYSTTHKQKQNQNQNSEIINMCRGFVEKERDTLKIKAFYTHFHLAAATNASILPDFLTLHFLPRINGTRLEINGSYIRPDTPAFVTLHRVLSEESKYGSRERVTACEGARFEIYAADVKLIKGTFRKDEEGDSWKMECKCVLSVNCLVKGVVAAEVAVAAEGLPYPGVMTQKVEMLVAARRRRRCCDQLEEIPEVREEEQGGSCCCSECGGAAVEAVDDAGDWKMEVDLDVEAVNWAVDVGIWVVCLGVGCLVSASSFKQLRRKRLI